MIGLEIIIKKKRPAKLAKRNEKYSYRFISNLLGMSFQGIARKCKTGTFTVQQALAIFNSLITDEKLKTLEFFEYLFTEQN